MIQKILDLIYKSTYYYNEESMREKRKLTMLKI